MRFSSVFSRTGAWVPLSLIALVLIAAAAWWYSNSMPTSYLLDNGAPPGQALYLLSKLVALIAIAIALFQLGLGIMRRVRRLAPLGRSAARWHALVGLLTLTLLLGHVLLFFLAVMFRTGNAPWHLLIPRVWSGYYELGLSLGLLSVMLILATVISGYLTRQMGQVARRIHWLSIPAVLIACIHGYMIGSEQQLLYLILIAAIALPVGIAAVSLQRHSVHHGES